jgi:hypothetical protein
MADIFDMADTWNDAGTTFTAIKMNATDTASAAGSLLMDLQVGGVSKFNVDKNGAFTANTATSGAAYLYGNGNGLITGISSGQSQGAYGPYGIRFGASATLSWGSSTTLGLTTADTTLARDAANTLAQRNGANAQAFRWYHSYTDASNHQRGALKTAAGYVEVAAETAGTGADDLDVLLTPAGTGKARFGTHAAIGAETLSGYITIKDAGGAERKLAVVS